MTDKNEKLRDFAWWLCVFFFGFIMALALLSTAWNCDIVDTETEYTVEQNVVTVCDEPVIEETFTIEEERVSGCHEPKLPTIKEEYDIYTVPPLELVGKFRVTAYCACQKCCGKSPDDPAYGITATGTRAKQGRTIAVDPRVIPYGTVLYFEGHDGLIGGYVAEDCGGAIKGNRIDLYFENHDEALQWGVKELDIYIIKEGDTWAL